MEVHAHLQFKIAVTRSIVFTVNETKCIRPRRHHEIFHAQILEEIVTLLAHSRLQLNHTALVVHFYTNLHELQIRLLAYITTAMSSATIAVNSTLGPSSDSRIKMLAERSPHPNEFPSVCIPRKLPASNCLGYRSRYSNRENGGGLKIGPARRPR